MKKLCFDATKLGHVPGPKSRSLMEKRERLIPRGLYNFHHVFVRRMEGALIEDVDGNVLIDFAGGIGCLNAGSTSPEVVAAINRQAEDFLFTCFHVAMHEPYLAVVERLLGQLPGDEPKKGMLVNSGAEAIENAIKMARAYTKRQAIITFQNSFHGRTLLTLALTSKTKTYKTGFGPFPSEVYRLPFAYCYRCPIHLEYPTCKVACADLLTEAFENQVASGDVAALVVEPVQGEGGFIVPPREYLPKLEAICREHGILFILDEIQTGIARTGTMFAFQHLNLTPDLVVLSKSIASGLPLSAVIGRADILDSPQIGGLGGTFGGNPLACAAALQVLDKIDRDDLCGKAAAMGEHLLARAHRWKEEFPRIGDIRADGAMVGIEFVEDRATKEPATEYVASLRQDCLSRGLLLISTGSQSNTVRFLIPLVIDEETLKQGLSIMEESMRSLP
jgi:4-aminobutyrate aminotransferase/(S)-3-amino-2-methylpropionate transaminase